MLCILELVIRLGVSQKSCNNLAPPSAIPLPYQLGRLDVGGCHVGGQFTRTRKLQRMTCCTKLAGSVHAAVNYGQPAWTDCSHCNFLLWLSLRVCSLVFCMRILDRVGRSWNPWLYCALISIFNTTSLIACVCIASFQWSHWPCALHRIFCKILDS